MGDAWSVIVFVVSLALLLLGIIRFKMNAGIMMLISGIVAGILLRMPFGDLISTVTAGFGNMMAGLGIVVGLGSILGGILNESGATDQLAYGMLKKVGSKNSTLALNATGFAVSIPVFMGPAYIVLSAEGRVRKFCDSACHFCVDHWTGSHINGCKWSFDFAGNLSRRFVFASSNRWCILAGKGV